MTLVSCSLYFYRDYVVCLQASERFEQFDKTFSVRYRYIFLLLDKFRDGTVAITYATGINTVAILHLRQSAGYFVASQKIVDNVAHRPFMAIQHFDCPHCEREQVYYL